MDAPVIHAPWVQVGGARVCLRQPELGAVQLSDIAWSLSRLPRFLGHTRGSVAYSVAQHTLWVLEAIERQRLSRPLRIAALLHDAHEAMVGDIPTPVKRAIGPAVSLLEGKLQDAVARRWGIEARLFRHPAILQADLQALAAEREALLNPTPAWGQDLPAPPMAAAAPITAIAAYRLWMSAAHALELT